MATSSTEQQPRTTDHARQTLDEADAAAFISIEKDKVVAVAPPQDLPELAQANIERLLEVFVQMRGGAAMPAHGVDEACAYCEMRGLCRKSEWSAA